MTQWKPLVGRFRLFPYEVSDAGEVRSFHRKWRLPRVMNPSPDRDGYRMVDIVSLDGDESRVAIHSLVAEAFLGLRQKGMTVNHKNGNKLDNRPENLEWCTVLENNAHATKTGLMPSGERHGRARLTTVQVSEILSRIASGDRVCGLSREYGVCQATISHIKSGKNWKHVPEILTDA